MIESIISPAYFRQFTQRTPAEGAAPSSDASIANSSSKTAALLPDSTSPVTESPGLEQQQDVNGRQDQSSLVEDLREAAERANRYFSRVDTHLEFVVGEETGRVIIRVIDNQTREVVRQIPPHQLQKLADHANRMRGLLFEARG